MRGRSLRKARRRKGRARGSVVAARPGTTRRPVQPRCAPHRRAAAAAASRSAAAGQAAGATRRRRARLWRKRQTACELVCINAQRPAPVSCACLCHSLRRAAAREARRVRRAKAARASSHVRGTCGSCANALRRATQLRCCVAVCRAGTAERMRLGRGREFPAATPAFPARAAGPACRAGRQTPDASSRQSASRSLPRDAPAG